MLDVIYAMNGLCAVTPAGCVGAEEGGLGVVDAGVLLWIGRVCLCFVRVEG